MKTSTFVLLVLCRFIRVRLLNHTTRGFFSSDETDCKCGCGESVHPSALEKLNLARYISGVPYVINSGARCVSYNKIVGGKGKSEHLTGEGFDISAVESGARFKVLVGLLLAGFTRLGIANSFIHAGNSKGKGKAQGVIWGYKNK